MSDTSLVGIGVALSFTEEGLLVEEVLSDSNGWYLPERTVKIRKLVESRISTLIDRL